VIIFACIARFELEPLDYGIRSVLHIQIIESKSIASVNKIVSLPVAEGPITKSQGAIHNPSVPGDGISIADQGNTSKLMSAPMTPPSADAYAPLNPKPPYPISSRENGEQGAVMLYACITDHGKVERLDLAQSSGHPALDRSALNTVRHWHFAPAQEGGKSIPMCYRLPIRFLLSSSALSLPHA
jgi:protein TonB